MPEDRAREGPSLHQRVRSSGGSVANTVVPDIIHREVMPDVVVRISVVIGTKVRRVLRVDDVGILPGGVRAKRGDRIVGNFIQRVAIGVARLKCQATLEVMLHSQNEACIVRIGNVLFLLDYAKPPVWYRRGQIRKRRWGVRIESGVGD